MPGSATSALTCIVDRSADPVGNLAAAESGPPDDNHSDQLAQASGRPADPHSPADSDEDGRGMHTTAEPLTTLIEQLQENWDHGDDAANDEVVMRIREHIRRQQAAASGRGG